MWTEDINAFEMILRTTVTFIVLLLLTRFLGKEQLSQLTMFNYITGIPIDSIAADLAGQQETPFIDGMISLIMWTLLTILVSWITLKSMHAKTRIDDEPSVVIHKGRILRKSSTPSSRKTANSTLIAAMTTDLFATCEGIFSFLRISSEISPLLVKICKVQ